MKIKKLLPVLFIVSLLLLSCSNNDDSSTETSSEILSETNQYGIFKVLANNSTIEMNGTINSSSLANFNDLENDFPNVNLINIINCDGSSDDEINLQLSRKIHTKKMNTHLMDNGEIASGGTDFYLAGIKRTRGSNTRIGVHSWAGDNEEATDFPVGHSNHLPYINYYISVGFTQQLAEDFYYFTINAATADSMHWMTDEEIKRYGLLKP